MLIDKAGEVFQFTVSSQHLHNRIYDRIYEYTIAYTNIRSNIEYAIECRINEKIVVGDVGRPDNPPSAILHPKIDTSNCSLASATYANISRKISIILQAYLT